MDTQKLHDLIDRVIGKKGPLRVPAYWMGNLMNEFVSYIDKIATSLRAFFSEKLNQKLDCLKSLTYQEFYEAHIKNQLVEGATYHIKDYKPVLSVRETSLPIVEYPPKYDLYIIYSRNIVRYESETGSVTFFDNTAFDGYVILRESHTNGHKYKIKYVTHDYESRKSMYWVPSESEWIQEMTVSIYSGFEGEGIKELDLLFTRDEGNQISYVDKNTNEIYAVESVNTKSNRVKLVKDSKYGYGNIIKYSLRTYGNIIRMQDEVNNFDVCYDFIGIKSPFMISLSNANITISGYPSGYLPRISLSHKEGRDITIINSTDIEVSGGSILINTVFIDSDRISVDNSKVENTKFEDSSDITIESRSTVKNTVFSNSSDITCNSARYYEINNCCVLLSRYIDLISSIHDCNIYNCYSSKITSCIRSYINDCSWVDVKQVQYSNIRASGAVDNAKVISGDNISVCGNKLANLLVLREGVVGYYSDNMNKVNIPTITSLVTDESSGKTVDIIIQELQGKIDALGGGGTAFTSLVEIPSWEVGDDARMYLPEQYAEQVLSGNCSIMYQMLIYVPLTLNGRNLMFLSYTYPTTGGEASLGCRLVSINVDDRSVIEDSTEIDLSAYALKTEVPAVVDNLTEGGATKALSAEQGKVLKTRVDALEGGNTYVFEYTSQETVTQDEYNTIKTVIANNGIVIVKYGGYTTTVATMVDNNNIVLTVFLEGVLCTWTIFYNLDVIFDTLNLVSQISDLQARVAALEGK